MLTQRGQHINSKLSMMPSVLYLMTNTLILQLLHLLHPWEGEERMVIGELS